MSSAGIQAGEAVVGSWKPQPQIKFSGKSGGVSYFEQLVMKRHRYDPMVLSRAKHNVPSDSVKGVDNKDLPFDKDIDTPSEYNIFYSPEVVELASHEMKPESGNGISPPTATNVEIVELNIGQPVASADPGDVTIKPSQLPDEDLSPVYKKTTKLLKSSDTKRPKSVSKKRAHSSRLKTKQTHSVSPHRSSSVLSVQSSLKLSELDMQASVKRAWTQCSDQVQLSQFFLQGVEPTGAQNADKSDYAERDTAVALLFSNSNLSSTVWLPGNSTSQELLHNDIIDPATDLPPLVSNQRPQSQPRLYSSSHRQSESDDEDDDQDTHDLELSMSNLEDCDVWERQEQDKEDDTALENLAWELASTVESEGRLTRCESELEDGEEDVSTPPASPGGDIEQGLFPLTDLSQVMSEFELYMHQQTDVDQESD